MASIPIVLLVVLICNVCSINSESSSEDSHHKYDMVKMVQDASNHLSSSKNIRKLIDEHGVSVLDEFRSFTAENFYSFLIENFNNNGSDKCIQDLFYVFENIRSKWSISMFDSFGKLERGFMQGNLQWLGEYDECINVYAPPNGNDGDFHGQYCNMQITVHLFGQNLPITIGSCLPDSCDPTKGLLNATIYRSKHLLMPNGAIADIKLTCNPLFKSYTTAAICVIVFLSIFIALAFIGSLITVYEHVAGIDTSKNVLSPSGFDEKKTSSANGDIDRLSQHGDDDLPILVFSRTYRRLPKWIEKIKPFFNCFCIFTNGAKLLDTSNSEGQLPCLHGIRFLSLSWVIVCHTYAFVIAYARNVIGILTKADHWEFQIIMNGFFSVDSFFLLSGFLLAYLFFEAASKNNGKVPWLYIYIHRYVRLTPVYMIVLAFQTAIYPYLSNGPLWTTMEVDQNCKKNWWKNLLYINNFSGSTEMCIGWSWYLSNDMQFFVISPIILIALWKSPVIGLAVLAFLLNATTWVNFAISNQYNLVSGLGNIFEAAQPQNFMAGAWMDYFNKLYTKPYARISPYLIGIALAYYLYQRRQKGSGKNSLVVLASGWLLSTTVTLACLFGLYHRNMSVLEMSFYNAFNRTCFALGLAWVIYVCLTGQGGVVNKILSFKPFIPLSRLTYCAYLVHPIVMFTYYTSMRSLIDFSHLTMIVLFLGFLVVSYSVALITSLLFESPVIRLDKLVRSSFGGK